MAQTPSVPFGLGVLKNRTVRAGTWQKEDPICQAVQSEREERSGQIIVKFKAKKTQGQGDEDRRRGSATKELPAIPAQAEFALGLFYYFRLPVCGQAEREATAAFLLPVPSPPPSPKKMRYCF